MIIKNLLILTTACLLVACDWVDSTGRESNSAPVVQISFADDDGNGQRSGVGVMDEQSELDLTVSATDADGDVSRYVWQTEPVAQGALNQCAGFTDFKIEEAVDSLKAACTQTAECVVSFEQQQQNDGANGAIANNDVMFKVKSPELRASVGVTYQLNTIDNDGGTGTQQSTFCLVAINEAPDAKDDKYTVLEGQTLTVPSVLYPQNILANDEQDDHISNEDLIVIQEPVQAPVHATSFLLDSEGGFTYVAPLLTNQDAGGIVDTFIYTVTDGMHESTATVTVEVVAKNDAPVLARPIPLQEIIVGVEFESDLGDFFTDPDGNDLTFTLSSGMLPESGELSLLNTGVLSGTAEPFEVGDYTVEITASDGNAQTSAIVNINVAPNSSVEVLSIPDQQNELGDVFKLDLSNYFTDPENAPLMYSVTHTYLTATVKVNAMTGELTAEFTDEGIYTINVSADDGVNESTGTSFRVDVSSDNVAPVFLSAFPISDRSARVGAAITPVDVSTRFRDPDGDVLRYSVADGTLPRGLTLTEAGLLFGIPTVFGTFSGISVEATDPFEESATSNTFTILVRRALPITTSAP